MEIPLISLPKQITLSDIVGLRLCEILPQGKEPSIRTLREWTKLRITKPSAEPISVESLIATTREREKRRDVELS